MHHAYAWKVSRRLLVSTVGYIVALIYLEDGWSVYILSPVCRELLYTPLISVAVAMSLVLLVCEYAHIPSQKMWRTHIDVLHDLFEPLAGAVGLGCIYGNVTFDHGVTSAWEYIVFWFLASFFVWGAMAFRRGTIDPHAQKKTKTAFRDV